eukprot:COSAG02_NODE_51087_length_316_cov_0.949309_2_plen_36_part_01
MIDSTARPLVQCYSTGESTNFVVGCTVLDLTHVRDA